MTERLLALLKARTNTRGVVLADEEMLLGELQTTSDELRAALRKLEDACLVDALSPLPFLVARLRGKWPGKGENTASARPSAYSHSFGLSNNRLNKSYRPTSNDALLREILETLGETNPKSFEGAIVNFSPEVIRKALDRVRRTRSLRKNRTALFRYLLTKLS